MNRILLFCAFVACLLQGCKQNTSAENDGETDSSDSVEMVDEDPMEDETDELISEEPMPQAAEEFFDDFFFNFASNKRLQKERVSFPLLVYSNAKTDTLERKDWVNFKVIPMAGNIQIIFYRKNGCLGSASDRRSRHPSARVPGSGPVRGSPLFPDRPSPAPRRQSPRPFPY